MKPSDVTREWLEGRCIEDGECLVWQGWVAHGSQPRQRFRDPPSGLDSTLHLRPIVWRMSGRRLRNGEVLIATCGCGRCLNTNHMRIKTRAEMLLRNANGNAKAKRRAAVTQGVRAAKAKITIEQARYIRQSDKTLVEVAQECGVSFQLASKIRRGEAWPDAANPFAGLGA